jgi:hypothetical protein
MSHKQVATNEAVKHGLSAGRLLPKGCGFIILLTQRLQRALESAVAAQGGALGVWEHACINSAVRWERHALLAQRWLRIEGEGMDPAARLAYSREIARASSERDKCLERLGLDKGEPDIFNALYGPATPPNGPDAEQTQDSDQDASGPTVDAGSDQEGSKA